MKYFLCLFLFIILTSIFTPFSVMAQTPDYCGQPCSDACFPVNQPTPIDWQKSFCGFYMDPRLTCKNINSSNYCVLYPDNNCATKEECCTAPTPQPTISGGPQPTSATNSWLDNDKNLIRQSSWFNQHQYADCSDGFYPIIAVDCLISDQSPGPSQQDQQIIKDPTGLYYKHLTPADMMSIIGFSYAFSNQDDVINDGFWDLIMRQIINKILQNPARYASISFDSLILGLEGGSSGPIVRSLSLYVHPVVERPISNAVTSLTRAKNLYVPYVEGAVGHDVNDEDVHQLYLAALNKCGSEAINGDQSGFGVTRDFGNYIGVVQWWSINDPNSHVPKSNSDCNIHLVKKPANQTNPLTYFLKKIIDYLLGN